MNRSAISYIVPLLIGEIRGVSSLYFFSTLMVPDKNFEELALGEDNTATLSMVDQVVVHCGNLEDAQPCFSGYNKFGTNDGNSLPREF